MLSDRIYYLRRKYGMSQAELARKLNITPSAEGMYEQGRRVPSVEILTHLSTIFDVSLDYLITGVEFRSSKSPAEMQQLAHECPCNSCFWKKYIDA